MKIPIKGLRVGLEFGPTLWVSPFARAGVFTLYALEALLLYAVCVGASRMD